MGFILWDNCNILDSGNNEMESNDGMGTIMEHNGQDIISMKHNWYCIIGNHWWVIIPIAMKHIYNIAIIICQPSHDDN